MSRGGRRRSRIDASRKPREVDVVIEMPTHQLRTQTVPASNFTSRNGPAPANCFNSLLLSFLNYRPNHKTVDTSYRVLCYAGTINHQSLKPQNSRRRTSQLITSHCLKLSEFSAMPGSPLAGHCSHLGVPALGLTLVV